MKLGAIFKRGANLFKLGVAARKFRKSTTEDQRHWAQNYLIELLGQSRGLPTKVGQFITMDSGDQGLRESLNNSLEPMHFEEVMELIEKAVVHINHSHRSQFTLLPDCRTCDSRDVG